jgi:hypothetical protein
MTIPLQFPKVLEKIQEYGCLLQCLTLVEQVLSCLITSWLPHKPSAISVKQATIGTVFTKESPNSHIHLYGVVIFFSSRSSFLDQQVKSDVA